MIDFDDIDEENDIDLERFEEQQNEPLREDPSRTIYQQALAELKAGKKASHWMWFVFPQCDGVADHYGQKPSEMTVWFGIAGLVEAEAYLKHEVLGPRLIDCFATCLESGISDPVTIFGETDAAKLKACATLFERTPEAPAVFSVALDTFFGGERCAATVALTGAH
jgi:uncharacterized protein (DUF1810 family)